MRAGSSSWRKPHERLAFLARRVPRRDGRHPRPLRLVVLMTVPLALAGVWAFSVLAVLAIVIREIAIPRPARLAPDPAFADKALAEDEQWAGIEQEWHEFVDSLPVREKAA
jgi:hypothetical protein